MRSIVAGLVAVLALTALGCRTDEVNDLSEVTAPSTAPALEVIDRIPAAAADPRPATVKAQNFSDVESTLSDIDNDLNDLDAGLRDAEVQSSENDVP